jgi:sodium-dependent dicarboxylate transporter 2/3/5|tara:strand:- start:1752 stop:3146 length:1395 start_codon:yes stop_codon:yes gene_type:complete
MICAPFLALIGGWLAHSSGLGLPAATTMMVAIWTALWWIFEAVPIPITSLVPLALLPLFGVLSAEQVAGAYGHKLVLLLLGGFLLSKAMERSGAHRRIALKMVRVCGGGGGRPLVLGFMLASAGLSMWISNTATTLMMLPMAIAVLQGAEDKEIKVPLLLGIAFAANVGGIGTPIGTPPNMVMIGYFEQEFGKEIAFVDWMQVGIPVSIIMVLLIFVWITRGIKGRSAVPLPDPGSWRKEETRTLLVFGLTALAWITRSSPYGGWKNWFGTLPQDLEQLQDLFVNANDASVAFIAVVLLFCLPNGMGKGERLLDWRTANEVPWGLLILVGAGMCLGTAFKESGLSAALASALTGLGKVDPVYLILSVALLVTFLTEMTSNTATTNILMPILGAVAVASMLDPKLLLLPATISASCAFMLPVATMPNAVVFGTGEVSIKRMAREGFVLNLAGAVIVTFVCYIFLK